jgi:acetyl esterase/lipase
MTDPSPAPSPDRRAERARLVTLVAVLAALSSACATTLPAPARADHRPDDPAGDPTMTARSGPGTVPGTTGTTPAPADALPDPGVGPGTCAVVVYTPPTAREAQRGELCRPTTGQRDVAVVVVHGGSGIGGTYKGLRPWADRYRAEGYVTFLPDYHLFVPGSGERPVFPRPEQNLKAAVQFVRGVARAVGVRADRVVVQGQSAGARMGAVAYTTPDDPWFAGPELYDGISDAMGAFIGFYHPYDGTMQYSDQYFGTSPVNRDHGNSLRHPRGAQGPALFITGSRDWNLITTQQDAFARALRAEGHPARAVVIEGGAHGFDEGNGARLSNLGEKAAVETLRFLDETFPPSG